MTEKICPFQTCYSPTNGVVQTDCLRTGCQVWVSVTRNRIVQAGETTFADPEYEYHYDGCGLVQVCPWELVKKEKKP